MRIAVVGSGVAGLGAAWALSRGHRVTLFEADPRLGGHAHTVEIEDAGSSVAVDTGFIVFNPANYPNLVALFAALEVPTEASDMSFAVSADDGRFEYQARALGLAAQPANLMRRGYREMVGDILRFCREAPSVVAAGSPESIGEYLSREGYGAAFRDGFLLPMIGCIWSSRLRDMTDYPAATLVRFLGNHGLLDIGTRPDWRTVTGGSRAYVARLTAALPDVRTDTPIAELRRLGDGVELRDRRGAVATYDHVVFATHADITARILGDEAGEAERRLLGAFRFQENRAVLHRDASLMPRRRRAWSSWNYLSAGPIGTGGDEDVSLSYWMNRLQNLRTAQPVIVTLNPHREPQGWSRSFDYRHPVFDAGSVRAQGELPAIQGADRVWFAGAWTGYGFHEDGLRSGLAVAAALGQPAAWAGAPRRIEDAPPAGTTVRDAVLELA